MISRITRALLTALIALALTACMEAGPPAWGTAQAQEPAQLPTAATLPTAPMQPVPPATASLACPAPAPTPAGTALLYAGKSARCPALVLVKFGEGFSEKAWIARDGTPTDVYEGLAEVQQ